MNAEIFIILVLTHFVSDYFFQPTYWGMNKIKKLSSRFLHSMQYAIIFLPVFYFLNISFLWLIYLFATHIIVDTYVLVHFWNKYIRNAIMKKSLPKNEPPLSVVITEDQIIHILLLIPLTI